MFKAIDIGRIDFPLPGKPLRLAVISKNCAPFLGVPVSRPATVAHAAAPERGTPRKGRNNKRVPKNKLVPKLLLGNAVRKFPLALTFLETGDWKPA